MSPGKLAAQVSHASMAFVAQLIREGGLQKREPLDETTYERYEIFYPPNTRETLQFSGLERILFLG